MAEHLSTERLAVITGGAGDLAGATAAALSRPGWKVETPTRVELDVTRLDSVQSYFQGRDVSLLVCNAGIIRDVLLARMCPDDWQELWDVNFRGARDCVRASLAGMRRLGQGHVIFLSSYSALHPPLGQVAYATAKAALLGLTRGLSAELGAEQIRVNAILPGFLETRMTQGVSDFRREEVRAAHVLGRFNTCQAVAGMIAFLHHGLPHTSGQVFQLDSRP